MTVLLALLLGVARPPAAYVSTPAGHVPLAISSWCWGTRCGAPIASSQKVAKVRRGSTVTVVLGFTPTKATVAVVGHPVKVATAGHDISWRASRAGGVSIRVTSTRGWVIYVGRVALH